MQLERHGWDIHAVSAWRDRTAGGAGQEAGLGQRAGLGSGRGGGWDAWGEWNDWGG